MTKQKNTLQNPFKSQQYFQPSYATSTYHSSKVFPPKQHTNYQSKITSSYQSKSHNYLSNAYQSDPYKAYGSPNKSLTYKPLDYLNRPPSTNRLNNEPFINNYDPFKKINIPLSSRVKDQLMGKVFFERELLAGNVMGAQAHRYIPQYLKTHQRNQQYEMSKNNYQPTIQWDTNNNFNNSIRSNYGQRTDPRLRLASSRSAQHYNGNEEKFKLQPSIYERSGLNQQKSMNKVHFDKSGIQGSSTSIRKSLKNIHSYDHYKEEQPTNTLFLESKGVTYYLHQHTIDQ